MFWISLTRAHDGQEVLLNLVQCIAVGKCADRTDIKTGCELLFAGSVCIKVTENFETVRAMFGEIAERSKS